MNISGLPNPKMESPLDAREKGTIYVHLNGAVVCAEVCEDVERKQLVVKLV